MKQRSYTATGINLKAMAMGETDRLVTVLTKERGLLRAIAPGARKHKSRLGGRTGLFVVNECLFTKGKSLDKLVQAETQRSFPGLSKNLAKLTASQYLAEVALSQALTEQPQEELYYLLIEHLSRLESASQASILPCLAQATFHLLALAGVAPEVFRCALTRSPLEIELGNPDWRVGFSVSSGGAIALEEIERIEQERLAQVERLEEDRLVRAGKLPATPPPRAEIAAERGAEIDAETSVEMIKEDTQLYAEPAAVTRTAREKRVPSSYSQKMARPTFLNPNGSVGRGASKSFQASVSKEIARDLGLVGYLSASELALMQQLSKPELVMSAPLSTTRAKAPVDAVSDTSFDEEGPGFGYHSSRLSPQSGTIGLNNLSLPPSGPHMMWRHIEKFLRHYAQYQFDRPIRSAALIDTCFS
ncbi:MAG: DNA repair protein RecO [Cyanobacteria bacterium P01_A01_bin.116]